MFWVPIIAWSAALVVMLVILGFCGYELAWKARRLRADVAKLQVLTGQLQALQADVAATQMRAALSARAR